MRQAIFRIVGSVQGVGFRVFVARIAKDLNLTGWVKNEEDGSVSILAQGEADAILRLSTRLAGIHHAPVGPDVKSADIMEEKEISSLTYKIFTISD